MSNLGISSKRKLFSLAILGIILPVGLLTTFKLAGMQREPATVSETDLFKFVWDDSLRGYYIVSDEVFSLKVYVLSLPDVGNYRVSNHSAVVDGVIQAVKIRFGASQVKELHISLGFDLVMKLNVNISYSMIEDWNTYRMFVEAANNTIIVNTHDEYLPIPEGYRKEQWTDKIADFMLNRWGTWVHAGGYPLYRIWYQNGTKEEWGENGFRRLMSHIGKPNVTCSPPPGWSSTDSNYWATFDGGAAQGMGASWFLYGEPISRFHYASLGYPINIFDFEEQYLDGIYMYGQYKPGATVRFSQNGPFNFGIYIHMSPWQFYNVDGEELTSDIALGFLSTAAAIYSEFYYAPHVLYGGGVDSASEAIQRAEREGRTIGLAEAKNLFLDSLDVFSSGDYKLASAYANQAKQTAKKATALNTIPQAIATIAIVITSAVGIAAYKINNKKKQGEHE